jgi:hypothetical protein
MDTNSPTSDKAPVDILVYILAPDEDKLACAREEYKEYPWAKPILLPQSQWLENIMYTSYLMDHKHEWEDKDYVGCMSWSATTKEKKVVLVKDVCQNAMDQGADVVALMYRRVRLIKAAEKYHPGFTTSWLAAWKALGFTNEKILLHEDIPSFFCNYWLARPEYMKNYCALMAYFDFRVESDPALRKILWRDSMYDQRGPEVAKIDEETKKTLFGVPYYPLLIFVCERMPCLFSALFSKKTCYLK